MTPIEIVVDVSRRLRDRSIRHLIGGSFASSAWGEIRTTNDVDVAILLLEGQAPAVTSAFDPPYRVSPDQIEQALQKPGIYRLANAMHTEEAFRVDLFFAQHDPYTLTEFARGRELEPVQGTKVPFAAPENIVLQKLRWFNETNRKSDRQWNDVVRVLEFQRMDLDYTYLNHWAQELGLEELLREALAQRTDEDPFA